MVTCNELIGRLHPIGVDVGFGITADQDLHDPTQMIAHIYASGLGLPDRDYYFKPDDRFVEARAKYHEHLVQMFILAGSTPEAADAAAISVFELEKRFAEATLDNVASRDPLLQDHKTKFDGLSAMAPDFDWGGYFDAARLPRADLNVTEPKFLEAFGRDSQKRRLNSGGAIWPGTSCIPSPTPCPRHLWSRTSPSTAGTLAAPPR